MPLLDTATGQTYYTLDGPAQAPVVVLSNSLGTDHRMWEAQLPVLTSQFRVLRYDTRGHGQSPVSPGPYRVAQLGRDVLAMLDALALERVHFCGLSLGGLIGQWLGINAPERLSKLILSNTAVKIATADVWNARIQQVEAQGVAALAEAAVGRWFTPAFRLAQPAQVQQIVAQFQATPAAGYAACCAAVRDADFWQDVRRIGATTYVFAGTDDPVTTVADGEYLAEHIPRAFLLPLRAAHLANIEAAPAFNSSLLRILSP